MYDLTIKNKILIVFSEMSVDQFLSFKFINIKLVYLLLIYQYMHMKYLYTMRPVGCEANLTYISVPNISIGGSIVKTI